jgi:hypothetical protein
LDNDRVFATYACTLIAAITSVLAASVLAGFAVLPSTGVFLEHLAMSLGFRALYKSFGGFDWLYATAEFAGMITAEAAEASAPSGGAQAAV